MPPDEGHDDRARAIEALKTSAMMAARAGVWDYDADGDRLCYCLGAARVLGLPAADRWTGLPFLQAATFVHPDDRLAYRARIGAMGRDGGAVSASFRTLPADGVSRNVLLQGFFEPGEDGRASHGRGVVLELSATPGAGAHGDADGASTFAALLTGIDLVLAARRTMLAMDEAARAAAITAVDVLLMALGRQVAERLSAEAAHGEPI